MFKLFATNRHFRRLLLGEGISLIGDWLTYVALSVLALHSGKGALTVAAVLLLHALPSTFMAPFAGPIVDRFNRKTVLVASAILRGSLALGMAYSAFRGWLTVLQMLLVIRVSFGAFVESASAAALPQLVDDESIGKANALMSASWSVLFASGMALGGVASTFLGPTKAILLDAFTFFAAAAVVAGLPSLPVKSGEKSDEDSAESAEKRPSLLKELYATLGKIGRAPKILEAVFSKAPASMASGATWVVMTQMANHGGDTGLRLGLLHGIRGVGTGVGPILWQKFFSKRFPNMPLAWTYAPQTLGILAVLFSRNLWVLAGGSLLWGMGTGANWVVATSAMQTRSPNEILGKVAALDLIGYTGGQCLGALACALLLESSVGPQQAALFGMGLMAVAAVVHWLFIRRARGEKPIEGLMGLGLLGGRRSLHSEAKCGWLEER